MASYVTISIILAALAVVASTLYNIRKSQKTFQHPEGPTNDYYQNSMQTIASKSWTTTVKMIAHFFVPVYKSEWPEITADKLLHRVNSDNPPLLIDIRSPEEYNGTDETVTYGHIPGAISIAILDLETKTEELQQYKDKEIVTMCPGGGLSLVAVDILTKAGFTDAKSLKGGTDQWYKKGYPTITQ
jgi:rhodanese-related sulfurtransferase